MKAPLLNYIREEETPSFNLRGTNTSFESHNGWTIYASNSSNTKSHDNPLGESYRSTRSRFFKVFA